ncbi:hypothetical protein ACH4E7_40665 [Kitasatospora sp. NPDC018058]|uniref:hypothetical protein n=1 Tax=Kitasatospora sp. NPDC018058 TaxID=3364025 RepID=UPI0037C0C61C
MADLNKHQSPVPVFDPALPTATQDTVAKLAAHHPDLLAPDSEASGLVMSYGNAQILKRSAAAAVGGGTAALAAFLLGQLPGQPADAPSQAGHLDALFRDLLGQFETIGLIVLAGGALMAVITALLTWSENHHMHRALEDARGHYVHPSWLTTDARAMLARAQQAAATILGSRLHQDDLGGLGAANAIQLPERLWTIADSLRRYSKTAKAGASATAEDSAVADLLAGERKALDLVATGIEAQVVALEEYARQAQEVDRIAADLATAERVEARSGAVRDLLAETAAAPAGVAEIEALTASAGIMTEAYTEALSAAKDAAAAALPPADRPSTI